MLYISFLLIIIFTLSASADELGSAHQSLDNIYQLFLAQQVDVTEVEKHYRQDVIHVGAVNRPLLEGKSTFIATNIKPVAAMVNSGQFSLEGKMYIVRLIIKGAMANDVGYLYSKVTTSNGKIIEQVQKFSWVFIKEKTRWQLVTDFDATPAPLTVLENIKAERIITL